MIMDISVGKKILGSALSLILLPLSAASQAAPPADHAKHAMESHDKAATSAQLVLLGTAAGPRLRQTRSQAASMLEIDGKRYLIDVGVGSAQRLVAAGRQPRDIDAIFISHHHYDHDGGLADMIGFSCLFQRERPVDVLGPFGTVDMVKAAGSYIAAPMRTFKQEGLSKACDPAATFLGQDIAEGQVFSDGNVVVTAVENSHYVTVPKAVVGLDKSFSFRFDTKYGSIVFTGDTGPSEAVNKLAKGSDILVTEVMNVDVTMEAFRKQARDEAHIEAMRHHHNAEHMSPEEIGKLATAAGVKVVVLTHFGPGQDHESDTEMYIAGIRKFFNGQVYAGSDLDKFSIPDLLTRR